MNTTEKNVEKTMILRVGMISLLCVICMITPGMAELFPAFDLNNQNGMPSYYYPIDDFVIFTDRTTSSDPSEKVMAYNWTITRNCPSGSDCSDEDVVICSNSSVPTFVFGPLSADLYPGNYTMNLTVVSNQYPWTSKSWEEMFTVDDYSEYIRANFSYSVDYETTQPNVTFFDLSEAQKLALINDWYWTLDGVQMGDSKSPIVSQNLNPGVYLVNLSVRDKTGDIASISKVIGIPSERSSQSTGQLIANFTALQRRGGAPFSAHFMDLSTGGPTAWNWVFGDGGTSSEKSPIHTYQRSGAYDVSLTVYNLTNSNTKEQENFIRVDSSTVKALFSYYYPYPDETLIVNFTDMSRGTGIDSWEWNFGDGGFSAEQNPQHIFEKHGYYVVSLKASNTIASDIRSYQFNP